MLPAAPPRRGVVYWSAAPSPVPTRPAPSDIGARSPKSAPPNRVHAAEFRHFCHVVSAGVAQGVVGQSGGQRATPANVGARGRSQAGTR